MVLAAIWQPLVNFHGQDDWWTSIKVYMKRHGQKRIHLTELTHGLVIGLKRCKHVQALMKSFLSFYSFSKLVFPYWLFHFSFGINFRAALLLWGHCWGRNLTQMKLDHSCKNRAAWKDIQYMGVWVVPESQSDISPSCSWGDHWGPCKTESGDINHAGGRRSCCLCLHVVKTLRCFP